LKSARVLKWIGVLLLLVVVAGAAGAWQMQQVKRAREHRRKWEPIVMPETVARVPSTWSAQTLAQRLKKSGKVRDADAFLEAAQQVGLTRVAEGGYKLPAKAGPLDLAKVFKQPPTLVKVTFPEGWTAAKMAQRLAANNFKAADEFKRLAYPANSLISPWEGRLFPDTYLLPHQGSGQQLLSRMHDRFKEVTARLPKTLPHAAENKALTLAQVVTLASLVERETYVDAERPLVAGVLLNRLRQGMRLQCDASVQYARERAQASGVLDAGHKERLLYRDLEIESPYNTYRNAGLPPGPICNPGQAALQAAAAPRASEYLFYVMSPKLKRHRFAKTFDEHRHNIALAKAEATALEARDNAPTATG
jgi:UPF0755 protein